MPLKLYQRSKLKQTAAALNSVPSWNFTFLRRLNVQVMPSGLGCQVSASAGTTSVPPCFVVTRPSKICRIGRNDSPSLTYAGSKVFGSADAPKTRAALPPPPLDFEPVPPPHAAAPRASAAIVATTAVRLAFNIDSASTSRRTGTLSSRARPGL